MKPSKKKISTAKEVLKAAGYIVYLFHREDILSVAEDKQVELEENEIQEIMNRLVSTDPNFGINWETIQFTIEDVLNDREV